MPHFDFTEWAKVNAIKWKYVLLKKKKNKNKKYIHLMSATIRAWGNIDLTREELETKKRRECHTFNLSNDNEVVQNCLTTSTLFQTLDFLSPFYLQFHDHINGVSERVHKALLPLKSECKPSATQDKGEPTRSGRLLVNKLIYPLDNVVNAIITPHNKKTYVRSSIPFRCPIQSTFVDTLKWNTRI